MGGGCLRAGHCYLNGGALCIYAENFLEVIHILEIVKTRTRLGNHQDWKGMWMDIFSFEQFLAYVPHFSACAFSAIVPC